MRPIGRDPVVVLVQRSDRIQKARARNTQILRALMGLTYPKRHDIPIFHR